MGRNAGWPENPVNHAERSSWLQGRGLSGRGHYAMVHRCHRWLQRVHQGSVLFFPRTLGHESIRTLTLKNIYLRITRVMFVKRKLLVVYKCVNILTFHWHSSTFVRIKKTIKIHESYRLIDDSYEQRIGRS